MSVFNVFRVGADANKIVTRTGFTAWLTVASAATMAFLAIFTLSVSFAANDLARQWSNDLVNTATVRISAPADQVEVQTQAAIAAFDTTPGVVSVSEISLDEQLNLLEPWLGGDIPTDLLPIPRMLAVDVDPVVLDPESLKLRLAAEAPGAVWDDHSRWRQPLVASASRLKLLSYISAALVLFGFTIMLALASNAALSANRGVIRTLRLIGATDMWIAGGFVRRFTLRAVLGAFIGTLIGALLIYGLAIYGDGAGVFRTVNFMQGLIPLILIIIFVAALVSYLTTQLSARRFLNRMA